MTLIGLDIGTTGCKASQFDIHGVLLGTASREYRVDIPHPGWAEQDIERVWQLAQETMREVVQKTAQPQVTAIGLSVHGEAVTAVDSAGRVLRPLILGMDTRTTQQNLQLSQQFGAQTLFEWTGMPVHSVNTLPKLLWMKQNEPEIWNRASRFLLVEDFLILRMTGQAAISACLASRTQLYNLHQGTWSIPILDYLGLNPARLSPILPSGSAVTPMQAELSRSIGFDHPPMIVTGGHDQACGALGVGLTQPGLAMVSTGTAEVVEVALPSPVVSQSLYEGNISVYQATVPGLFLAMTLNHSGGMLLRWFRDNFCEGDLQRALQNGHDAYDLILENASADPTSLLVLPHFSGSGTPWFDTSSKGAVLGLTFDTRRQDLAKAILEGLTYELRVNLDLLKSGGVKIDTLRAIGGGAKSRMWLQLKADITGIPVSVPKTTEAASFGAALLAGAGAGIYPSAAKAAEEFTHLNDSILPRPAQQALYDRTYSLYRQVYPAVKSISHQL